MGRAEHRRHEKLKGHAHETIALKGLLDDAMAHQRAGRLGQAEQLYNQVLQINSDQPDALHHLGLIAYRVGNLDQSVELLRRAVHHAPRNPLFHFNLGVVLQRQARWDEAEDSYRAAVNLKPGYAEALGNLGTVLREQGKLEKAVACFEKALSSNPSYVEAHNSLGVTLREQGNLEQAVAAYERALRLKPDHIEAHCNLGIVLKEQGRLDEAVASLDRALRLKPDYVKAHHNLGQAFLWKEDCARAFSALRRSAELQRNHGRPVGQTFVFKSQVKHDVEQIQYLMEGGQSGEDQASYLEALKRLRDRIARESGAAIRVPISKNECEGIASSFNRILYYADCPTLPQGALNPDLDLAEIEDRYNGCRPEIIYIDHLLNQEALSSLRRFCLESTIWKTAYENGYLGTFLADGFSCPLLLQISEELRLRLPAIFRDHRLAHAWAFKYDSELTGLNIHADAAAVNVNFWITPDEANLDPERGGLVVWDKEAPREWNFREYNDKRNEPKIREFLKSCGAQAVRIPYRQNRAVVFNSDLFHETDHLTFKDDYESRRINVTLLYGYRTRE